MWDHILSHACVYVCIYNYIDACTFIAQIIDHFAKRIYPAAKRIDYMLCVLHHFTKVLTIFIDAMDTQHIPDNTDCNTIYNKLTIRHNFK